MYSTSIYSPFRYDIHYGLIATPTYMIIKDDTLYTGHWDYELDTREVLGDLYGQSDKYDEAMEVLKKIPIIWEKQDIEVANKSVSDIYGEEIDIKGFYSSALMLEPMLAVYIGQNGSLEGLEGLERDDFLTVNKQLSEKIEVTNYDYIGNNKWLSNKIVYYFGEYFKVRISAENGFVTKVEKVVNYGVPTEEVGWTYSITYGTAEIQIPEDYKNATEVLP